MKAVLSLNKKPDLLFFASPQVLNLKDRALAQCETEIPDLLVGIIPDGNFSNTSLPEEIGRNKT